MSTSRIFTVLPLVVTAAAASFVGCAKEAPPALPPPTMALPSAAPSHEPAQPLVDDVLGPRPHVAQKPPFKPAAPTVITGPNGLTIWLVQQGEPGWAVFLVVWSLAVAIVIDNLLKPIIIGRSSHVPFILIMLGVLGGAAAFGLLGVFVGPTLLAVAHAVLRDWVSVKTGRAPAVPPAAHTPAPLAGAAQGSGADPGLTARVRAPGPGGRPGEGRPG